MEEFIRHYGDIAVFIGMFFAGEAVLFPAIYLALIGLLGWWHLVILAVIATTFSDFAWYVIGRKLRTHSKERKLSDLKVFGFGKNALERVSQLFEHYGPRIIIGSKFIYGTRTLTQFVSGYKHMPMRLYIKFNAIAVGIWLALMLFIGSLIALGFRSLGGAVKKAEIALAVIFVIIIPIYLWIRTLIGKRWRVPLSPLLTKEQPSEEL